uniref:Uncharacterized protein n=1 Tax=Rhizophora mucronata TaxID=61149 RepID=A0A2P2QMR7_RHIMU
MPPDRTAANSSRLQTYKPPAIVSFYAEGLELPSLAYPLPGTRNAFPQSPDTDRRSLAGRFFERWLRRSAWIYQTTSQSTDTTSRRG